MLHNLRMVSGLIREIPERIRKLCNLYVTKKGTPEGDPLSTGFRARGFRQFFEILGIIIFLVFRYFDGISYG